MSASTPITSAPSRATANGVSGQSRIYQAIMTPINFVTFIVSLYLIDTHHRAQRYRQHERNANGNKGRPWLHWLLYSQRSPYEMVNSSQTQVLQQSTTTTIRHETRVGDGDSGSWFYQTKQRKLLKVEATEAFALRNSVLFVLCVLAASVTWVFWRTMLWLATWGQRWIAFTSTRHADDP
ncbi:hypothetical protein GGR51DRAFT_521373 [Nemania sp. FL0031]|nr:hypothetical protein GGR51DRAFT_521373 [Nemania sp. FL0031]